MRIASPSFWCGKKVLLTGHTGFKGAWLALWLNELGAKVAGISLAPNSNPNLYSLANIAKITNSHFENICDAAAVKRVVDRVEPEIVLHLAAQSLVRPGYKDPLGTFATNIMGTANILNAVRDVNSVRVVVAITTDKVYKNLEHEYPYRETDALGGHDPYSASKAASEIIISCYKDSYLANQGVAIASARAGNVIGGGDWSMDRLIPDAIRAWSVGSSLEIRRPNSVRPWQHVLEPLNGYLVLAESLYEVPSLSGAYNFGPQTYEASTVRRVVELANNFYGRGEIVLGDGVDGPHEANLLSLEICKAKELLDVQPRWCLEEAIEKTISWYKQLDAGRSADLICKEDIAKFTGQCKVCI
jgi:CDP-glucose 4,6-dehydratase